MLNSIWIYEVILFLFAISLICYGIDFIKSNWKINKIALWLLSSTWLLQTAVIIYDVFYGKNLPILTLNDGIYMYAWVLLTFSLIMNRTFPIHFIVFFTNIFSFVVLWLAISLYTEQNVSENCIQFIHEILIAHIVFTIIAYGFLTLSFILAIMYLIQFRLLKNKQGIKWIWRFTNLTKLDTYSFSAVKIGVPFLFVGLLLGILWAHMSGEEFYWLDLKTIGSITLLGIYVAYLCLRWVGGYRGKAISVFNSATFLVLLVNFFLFSTLSNFHF